LRRERTGTERSDAGLEGLITKKAALFGVAVLSDRTEGDSAIDMGGAKAREISSTDHMM